MLDWGSAVALFAGKNPPWLAATKEAKGVLPRSVVSGCEIAESRFAGDVRSRHFRVL